MEVAISGASGLIGQALTQALKQEGHRPVALVRTQPRPGADEIGWNPQAGTIDSQSLDGLDAVVHLAGAGIGDRRWNAAYKQLLISSRVDGTRLLAGALASLNRPPSRLLSGSAIGYYGHRGDEILDEASPAGTGFLVDLVQQWEKATTPATQAGISTVALRTGIVLDDSGGALAKMIPLFRFGLGGRLGSGHQFMSWISLADEIRAIIHLLGSTVEGPVNLTAPSPVTNRQFTAELGSALRRPTLVPVPEFGPKLALGAEMAQALLFDSARVLPRALETDGFEFAHPTVEAALNSLFHRSARPK